MNTRKGIRLMALCLCAALLLGGCAKSTSAKYEDAKKYIIAGEYDKAITAFTEIDGYEDSSKYLMYVKAIQMAENGQYDLAISALEALDDFSDSKLLAVYYQARQYEQNQEYEQADKLYRTIPTFKDSAERIAAIPDLIFKRECAYAQMQIEQENYQNAVVILSKYPEELAKKQEALYQKAVALRTNGEYEQAINIFKELESYSDAEAQITETLYQKALSLNASGDYAAAYSVLAILKGYKDVDTLLSTDENLQAVAAAKAAFEAKWSIGNYVEFGTYPQIETGTDKTRIEWLVLARDGNKALIISRYGLDAQPYNTEYTEITWEQCTLRTWLNGTFMNTAFMSDEQNGIVLTNVDNSKSQGYGEWNTDGGNDTQDKIFLLSYAEANKYFGVEYWENSGAKENVQSRVAPTAYAIAQGAYPFGGEKTVEGQAAMVWWLRSPGSLQIGAGYVGTDGSLRTSFVVFDNFCVRPALWVNLDSDIFQSGN